MIKNEPIRVLYMEDDPGLARLVQKRLERAGYTVDLARDGEEGLAMYAAGSYDVVAVDQAMPVHDGLEVIRILASQGALPPTIMVTGSGNEKIAVEAMRLGAGDYIVKDVDGSYLDLLPFVIEQVLRQYRLAEERQRAEEMLRENEAVLSAVFDNAPIVMILVDRERRVRKANRSTLEFTGRSAEEMIGLRGGEALRCLHSLDDPKGCGFGPFCETCTVRRAVMDIFETGKGHYQVEASLPLARGEKQEGLTFLLTTTLLSVSKDQMVLLCIEDITERKRSEEALQQRNRELELLHRASRAFGSTLDLDQVLVTVLEEVRQLLGVVAASVWLIDPETGELVCRQATGPKSDVVRGWRLTPGEGIVGWVARHGGSLIVPDTQADERYFRGTAQQIGLDLRSILAVPLQVKQKVIGVLEVMDTEVGRFNPTHLTLLEPLAASAATAVENARLYEAEQERRQIAESLRQASAVLNSTLELGEVLGLILQQLREVISYDSASVQRLQDGYLEIVACQGFEEPDGVVGLVFPLDPKFPNYRVATTKAPLVIADVVRDYPHFKDEADTYESGRIRSWLGVPLMVRDQVVGMIAMDRMEVRPYTAEEAQLAMVFTNQAAIAIENARLFKREREQRELAEALEGAAAAVSSTLDLDQVLDRILRQVEQVVAGDAFSVMLIEDGSARLARWRGYELPGEAIQPSPFEISITTYPNLMRMVQMGKPVVVPDTSVASDWIPAGRDQGWRRSYVGAPIQVGGVTVGFLNVSGTRPGQFGPDDARRLEAFASHAAAAIENARLYEQARQDAETKSVLLHEVNHRVKNNLSAIIGLLYAEQRYARAEDPSAYRSMMEDLANRIRGLARVHNMLSAAQWAPLPLDELTRQIIHIALRMLPRDQHISVDVTPSPVRVTPKQANNLALVINELATNTVKYALPERHMAHIGVCIALEDDTVLFEFRDDGPGYPEEVLQLEHYNVGLYLIQTMVREGLGGELTLHNDRGAVTTIRFKKDPSGF